MLELGVVELPYVLEPVVLLDVPLVPAVELPLGFVDEVVFRFPLVFSVVVLGLELELP